MIDIGDRSAIFSDSNQTHSDAARREYSADSAAAIHLPDSNAFLDQINPGNAVDGVLIYDVPDDLTPSTIELHDSMFSPGATVNLG